MTVGVVLKPEGGGILSPRFFPSGTQACLIEEVTRMEDCGCPNLPADQRVREVVYYRFAFNDKTWLVRSTEASTGVPPGLNRTQQELQDRVGNVGETSPSVNVRNDAVIRENWGKLVM